MKNKYIIYPLLVLFLSMSLTIFSPTNGDSYIDLTGRFESAYFLDKNKLYIGYGNYVKELNIENGKIINKYNIFDEDISYQIYSKALLVYKENIFLVTNAKDEQYSTLEGKEYLFWYNLNKKKLIKKIEVHGPSNIIQLKNKDYILCGDKLIKLSENKIFQINTLSQDEEKNVESVADKSIFPKAQWSKWVITPKGDCYLLLTLYSSKETKNIFISNKLYQYEFLGNSYKRKELNNYGNTFSLDERSRIFEVLGNTMYFVSFDNMDCNINLYDLKKEIITKTYQIDFSKTWGIIACEKDKYIYYINIEYSDDGIVYADTYSKKNTYQKINILVIDALSQQVIKKISRVFHSEPINKINMFSIKKGIIYLVQDCWLGNEKKILALNMSDLQTINQKLLDIKFIPQIMTLNNILIGFEEGNLDDVKMVKVSF